MQSTLGFKSEMPCVCGVCLVCVCVCVFMQLIPLRISPFWTKLFTWPWNEKNLCVGEQRDPTCCERLCVCVCVCVCLAPIHRATPSQHELCLLTTSRGLYSFIWVCRCVYFLFFFPPCSPLTVMNAGRHSSRMGG